MKIRTKIIAGVTAVILVTVFLSTIGVGWLIGKQNDDGTIDDLNAELIDLCNKHKFEYELPTDLDKKSGLDDVEIEELDDELIESDDEVVDEFVEEELSEDEYEEIEEEYDEE